jgi:very-short-patch-repair endonuclease
MLNHHSRPQGRWHRAAPRVYEVLAQPADWRRPLMTALLWGGPGAILCGRSAADLLDLDGIDRHVVELYTPTGRPHPPWQVHRGRPSGVLTTKRLRHTEPLQTLRDVTRTIDEDHVERAVESALRQKLVTEADLRKEPLLRKVMSRRPKGAAPTESELETRMLQLLRKVDVPEPVRQHPVGHARLDLAFPDVGLAVECDGKAVHTDPVALFYDRHRQNGVVGRGAWTVLHYTWHDVVDHSLETARKVAEAYRAHAGLIGLIEVVPARAHR